MVSTFLDGYIRTIVLPSKYLNAPTQSPPTQRDSHALHVPEILIECLKYFDRNLIQLAPSRSFKSSSKVHVGGRSRVPVPQESVCDTELVHILSNWLLKFGWTTSGQWHLQTKCGSHKYSDIVLYKEVRGPDYHSRASCHRRLGFCPGPH